MYISEIYTTKPSTFENDTEKQIYDFLTQKNIEFHRVDTDAAVSMDLCPYIGKALGCPIVKTIFLSNRQLTSFYVYVTTAEKHFSAKQFGAGLGVSRVSFAPEEYLEKKLGTKIGATTALSAVAPITKDIRYVFDPDAIRGEWYGCSDGRTTGYMKIRTSDLLNIIIPDSGHIVETVEM